MKYLFALPLIYFPATYGVMQCPVDDLEKYTWSDPVDGPQLIVEADNVRASEQLATFTGNVIAKRGQEIFSGDHITHKRDTGDISASDSIVYGAPDFAIRADKGDYSMEDQTGSFYGLEYFLGINGATGEAEYGDFDRKKGVENLTGATYSTCPRSSRAWEIKAKTIKLDHESGIGETWDATFRIAGVPLLYLPYFTFSLNDNRKTGFLWPDVNLSENRGADITVPYYFNIASNMDATLYPRFMQKRGLMLGGEYRYLTENWAGRTSGTYLHDDRKYEDKRWSFSTEQEYRPTDNFHVKGKYQRVSDKSYLDDFDNTLDLDNDNFLESHMESTYDVSPDYQLTGEIKSYQVADEKYEKKNRPYAILPRIEGRGKWSLDNGVDLTSNTQITNFYKKNTVSGLRAVQELSAQYNMERDYGYIRPKADFHLTQYRLRDQAGNIDSMQTRAVPTFSLDSGLFLDRQMSWFGSGATQSVEPRLYYLYTPYRDQSELPNFDTSKVGVSYRSMFSNNRFTGKDRVGDANQLTTAVSTTVTNNETGEELAKLSVGQIQYFEDRQVALSGTVEDFSRSSMIAEGQMKVFDSIKLKSSLQFDTDESDTEKASVGIEYAPSDDKAISISHLYDQDNYEQVDFAGVWRVDDNWRAFSRFHYSLEYDKTVDVLAGVEYADCCWGLRLMARQERDSFKDEESDSETSVFLEFSLNGLGNIGSDTSTMLRAVIPNYRPISYEKK